VATALSVEKQIERVEGFPVTIRQLGRNIRDDRTGLPGYPFKRAAADRENVTAWKRTRFQPRYPGFEVDVLCSHIPPAVPELLYDTVARRLEKGSVALLEAIRVTKPRYSIFGHVHQPLSRRTRIGVTECLNVGHFRATGAPFVLQW